MSACAYRTCPGLADDTGVTCPRHTRWARMVGAGWPADLALDLAEIKATAGEQDCSPESDARADHDDRPREVTVTGWERSTGHKRTSTWAWQKTRARILARDGHICYLCGQPGADAVDHKLNVAAGGTDDDDNLGAVHDRVPPHCHRKKTSQEANAARVRVKRTPGRHPGLLP